MSSERLAVIDGAEAEPDRGENYTFDQVREMLQHKHDEWLAARAG